MTVAIPRISSSRGSSCNSNLLLLDPNSSEPNSKPQPQFTASLLKSATKFRVFMLGLKKSKPNVAAIRQRFQKCP
ncbi:putative membrane-associated kinase regulator 2 [Sesbania bispinosa]|nr:putative membrane-associated kinase regulator 2 [Sesbania bispinosa]